MIEFLLDGFFTLAACTSAGFLVYGAWLCLRPQAAPAARDAEERTEPQRQTLPHPGQLR